MRFWNLSPTDDIAKSILQPVERAVNIEDFLANPAWKSQYRAMFAAAADAMANDLDWWKIDSDHPNINHRAVYEAVRAVIQEEFPDRPPFEEVPEA